MSLFASDTETSHANDIPIYARATLNSVLYTGYLFIYAKKNQSKSKKFNSFKSQLELDPYRTLDH